MDVWRLIKLTPRQFGLAVLLIGVGWLSNQLTKKEVKIEKSAQRTEGEVDALRNQVTQLNKSLLDQKDSCNVEVREKDEEMKSLLRDLLNEQKAVNRQASKSEENVDRVISQTKKLNAIGR